jgi:hypothetical protein
MALAGNVQCSPELMIKCDQLTTGGQVLCGCGNATVASVTH